MNSSDLQEAESCHLEQLTYLDEDFTMAAFSKDNHEDLPFYNISAEHIVTAISKILKDFNEIAIANLSTNIPRKYVMQLLAECNGLYY